MLDRLMGGTILAQSDRIVRHDVDDAYTHQRGQPDRGTAVVGKAEERAAIGDETAMQRDAVHRRRHGVLADTIVNVAAAERIGTHRLVRLGPRQVGVGQVG